MSDVDDLREQLNRRVFLTDDRGRRVSAYDREHRARRRGGRELLFTVLAVALVIFAIARLAYRLRHP